MQMVLQRAPFVAVVGVHRRCERATVHGALPRGELPQGRLWQRLGATASRGRLCVA